MAQLGVPMVFVVFSRDSWGFKNPYIPTFFGAHIGISHRGTLVGVHPTIP